MNQTFEGLVSITPLVVNTILLTPKRVACEGEPSRNMLSKSTGLQTGLPKITVAEELTMMPIKLTIEKPSGIAMSCGHHAADGLVAREAKSGAFLASAR
jgi:hypothetical protein